MVNVWRIRGKIIKTVNTAC